MSDAIKHECGIAMVRLLKPLEYYRKKYGDVFWGMNKLYLLMEKQHNRGQEGAGMASVKLNARPGEEYIFRERAEGTGAIQDIFSAVHRAITECRRIEPEVPDEELPFIGEMYMGHLRYSTTGRSGISYLHPFLRRNNWRSRNLSLAGNFNLTNVDEILQYIVERGQHPRHNADTFIILEQLGYLLDYEVEHLYRRFKAEGLTGQAMNDAIEENIDIEHILQEASARWDGGYVITGLLGSGDLFAFRDPHGIRPAFYYASDEVIVVASERPVIQTVFDLPVTEVKELMPGQSIVVKRNGNMKVSTIHPAVEVTPCSFERIYFSRGSDCDIYNERKELGRLLTENILKSVGYDELYVGLETAYAPAVKLINKGFTVEEAYENIGKLKEAGMKYSALLMLGIGGKGHSKESVEATAALLNKYPPYRVSPLSTAVLRGSELEELCDKREYVQLTERELVEEEKMLLRALKINDCIFFGSHPYNLITISGVLPQDREEIIKHLDSEMAAWDRDQPGFLDTVWKRTDM